MQSFPSVLGLLLIAAGCMAGAGYNGQIEKWVSFNLISGGLLLIAENIISMICLFEPARMYAVYSITVTITTLVIILGCGRFYRDIS